LQLPEMSILTVFGWCTTVFFSHIAPALASSHQPNNYIFLSHHSNFSLKF